MAQICLLSRPATSGFAARPPARKSALLLTYLLLAGPTPRRRLADLLFAEAQDPLAALRWALGDLRRATDTRLELGGDPVTVEVPDEVEIDLLTLQEGQLPTRGAAGGEALLTWAEGAAGPELDLWLLGERHRLTRLVGTLAHDVALASLAADDHAEAIRCARTAVDLAPYDENAHALLLRCLRSAGRQDEAREHLAVASRLVLDLTGHAASPALAAALEERDATPPVTASSTRAVLETAQGLLHAGATEEALSRLETNVAAARRAGDRSLLLDALVAWGSALVHAARGRDEEGVAVLHEAAAMLDATTPHALASRVQRELGYVRLLRGDYPLASRWLRQALRATEDAGELAWAHAFVGAVLADTGRHDEAADQLRRSIALADAAGDLRCAAYARSFRGRSALLLGDLVPARAELARTVDDMRRCGYLSAVPWALALKAEAARAAGDRDAARADAEHAFSVACEMGDPCWEACGGRVLGLLAADEGRPEEAMRVLDDAAARGRRTPDSYTWALLWVDEARARTAVRYGLPAAPLLVAELATGAARHGITGFADRAAELQEQALPEQTPRGVGARVTAPSTRAPRAAVSRPRAPR